MGIQRLEIQGFRSLKNVTWEPGRLNLLVGPNGGGKSNVLRALEMISFASAYMLRSFVRSSGGVVPLLWDRTSKNIRLDVQFNEPERRNDRTQLSVEIKHVEGSAFSIERESLIAIEPAPQAIDHPVLGYERTNGRAKFVDSHGDTVDWRGKSSEQPDGFEQDELILPQIPVARSSLVGRVRSSILSWKILQGLDTSRDSQARSPVTTQAESELNDDGSNFVSVLFSHYSHDRSFKNAIDEGMRIGFGDDYREIVFLPASSGLMELSVRWASSSSPHPARDLSDGTLRFLFLLTALANPEPPDLIAIDEPDVGLHPSMLPIIAEYAARASQRTQVILTTHSPEFLDAFTGLNPTVTLCHWEEGETSLYTLTPDRLRPWLERYRLGEIFTSGELELLTLPPVDPVPDLEERLKAAGLNAINE